MNLLKGNLKLILKVVVLIIIIILFIFLLGKVYDKKISANLKDENWIRKNVSIEKSSINDKVYVVNKDENITTYNMKYQKVINDKINKKLEKGYTAKNPLIIYNPYETNYNSMNIYFNTDEEVSVSYKIEVSGYGDFERTLKNSGEDNYTKEHSYQLIGFILGKRNYLTITTTNKDGETKDYTYELDLTSYGNARETKMETLTENSEELSDGLFALLGESSDNQDYFNLYDNDGIIRSEVPIIGYRTLRLLFNDNNMYISISEKKIAKINSLGMVTKIYYLDNYKLHHDYVFDNDGNLVVLVSDTTKESCEDAIIKIDEETGEIINSFYLEDVLKDVRESAYYNEAEVAKEVESKGVDWMHINTVNYFDNDTVILSSRETSSIIKVSNIFSEPKLEYILGDSTFWENYDEKDYLYEKIGDFTIAGGQHTVTYEETDEDGVYYLTMFNNNLGISTTVPDFDWSSIGLSYSTPEDDGVSYYYKYKVDENNKTFELVQSFEVPYSAYMGSSQTYNGHIIVDSAQACEFSERNSDGDIIKTYYHDCESSIYRVFKYDLKDYLFK